LVLDRITRCLIGRARAEALGIKGKTITPSLAALTRTQA
jgi:hypothetical protein